MYVCMYNNRERCHVSFPRSQPCTLPAAPGSELEAQRFVCMNMYVCMLLCATRSTRRGHVCVCVFECMHHRTFKSTPEHLSHEFSCVYVCLFLYLCIHTSHDFLFVFEFVFVCLCIHTCMYTAESAKAASLYEFFVCVSVFLCLCTHNCMHTTESAKAASLT
jgi:hypothetical protein